MKQMVMAANGYYVVGINPFAPSVKIYSVPDKSFVFEETIHSSSVYLRKANETHIIVAI